MLLVLVTRELRLLLTLWLIDCGVRKFVACPFPLSHVCLITCGLLQRWQYWRLLVCTLEFRRMLKWLVRRMSTEMKVCIINMSARFIMNSTAFDSWWWRWLISSRDGRMLKLPIKAVGSLMAFTSWILFGLWHLLECCGLARGSSVGIPVESGNMWSWFWLFVDFVTDGFGSESHPSQVLGFWISSLRVWF